MVSCFMTDAKSKVLPLIVVYVVFVIDNMIKMNICLEFHCLRLP